MHFLVLSSPLLALKNVQRNFHTIKSAFFLLDKRWSRETVFYCIDEPLISGRLLSILNETEEQHWIVRVVMHQRGLVILEMN